MAFDNQHCQWHHLGRSFVDVDCFGRKAYEKAEQTE